MAAHKCWNCGELRKVDIIYAPDGIHQPPCYHCGDPGYTEPYNDRGRYENVYASMERTLGGENEDIPLVVYHLDLYIGKMHYWEKQVLLEQDLELLRTDADDVVRLLWEEMIKLMDDRLAKAGLD